ncbi:Zinc finger ccch domain-containing protein [Thalictrum thalictroides]|uniref:Zinc finger ccch domain-containing protein n=1 Tax=Thalictrum thalictroides TaxID=46969 RepID=A0A7J6WHA1_THATH|nr:Zinc finger ccch domain-containing protein [Thalictrum thalictroides]
MKAVTRESSQPQSTPSAEDEALKRNTDCVYFLASPLTCKKGIECEYRHSEEARMNPRDCWYWVNGNCLNPKCSFRHPPLDGLVGTPVGTSGKSALPPSLPAALSQSSAANFAAYNPVKQGTPCFYFQKGLCLKGDRCAFMHGSQPIDHAITQAPAPKISQSVPEPQTLKKPIWALEKCSQPNNNPQANVIRPVEVPAPAKPSIKALARPVENGIIAEKNLRPVPFNNEPSRFKAVNTPSIIGGISVSRTHRGRQAQPLDDRSLRNGKEPDEFLGESSPGFDVLVDDELRESEYYQKEDDFGRMTDRGGRQLKSLNESDYGRSADYNSVSKFDRETYSDARGYDTYGRMQDQYAWEQRRASSERISERQSVPERRALPRAQSPDEVDLRYRLSKQRKINGSRSAVSPDSRGEFNRRDDRARHVEDQRYHAYGRRDAHHISHENSLSNRLQGRISLPGRSSPDRNRSDSRIEKEMDRGRNWGTRSSPSRPPILSNPGRPQDRIRRRVDDDFNTENRNFRAPLLRRDESDNTIDFAGPKRLLELKKGAKMSDRGEEQHSRVKETYSGEKVRKLESYHDLDGSSSFEGPKPLREILKRKRQDKTAVSDGSTRKEREETALTVGSDKQADFKQETNDQDLSTKEDANGFEDDEEGLITEEVEGQPAVQKGSKVENEDMIMLDNGEDEDFEGSDQRDVDSDYEQVEGDFKTEEDENPDPEEEYFDDEDGDDFAKRIGVMFS